MALFCKENHCGSCEKAFCCFSCRSKHENIVHKKTKAESIRKALAPINSKMYQSCNNSLPRIPESVAVDFKYFGLNNSKKEQKKNPICIYNGKSNLLQLECLKSDDKGKEPCEKAKNAEKETINSILTEEKTTRQTNKVTRLALAKRLLCLTVNVHEDVENSDGSQQMNISESAESIVENSSFSTAGNTPPRTQELGQLETSTQGESTIENSSVYCACFENLTRSGINSTSTNEKSEMSDSLLTEEISEYKENKENVEKSSIYFACSENLTKESCADILDGSNGYLEEFDAFENDTKIASTKLELTISFPAESYYEAKSESRIETINSTDAEYMTANHTENSDHKNTKSNDDNISNDNGTDSTISAHNNSQSSIPRDCSPINAEKPEPHPVFIGTWVKTCTTQTSAVTSSSGDIFKVAEESKENLHETNGDNESSRTSSTVDSSLAATADNSLWQSFSHSLQRAYNSTKAMCNSLGSKNQSKRELDDVEELQPEPKRPKISILCRRPIRENPRIIFRQDGDTRRPVIAFDKGTQTDLLY